MKIHTERFELIRIDESHVSNKYVDWLNEPEINQYLEVRHIQHTIKSTIEFLKSVSKSEVDYLFGVYSEGDHIGNIKIGPIDKLYSVADIGLMIGDKQWWGKGVATEIIHAVTQFGFETLELEKIEAGCYEDNIGSKKAFLRCGYQEEGFIREHFVSHGKRVGCFKLGMTLSEWNNG